MRLELEKLSVRVGRTRILHGITCGFQGGRIAAVIGANGAGKSTLLDCLSGFVHPSEGSVLLNGLKLTGRRWAHAAGRLHQRTVIPETVTCGDLLRLASHPRAGSWLLAKWKDEEQQTGSAAGIHSLMERGGISLTSLVSEISGGQRRLLALGAILVTQKPILLLDEPFAGIAQGIATDVSVAIRAQAAAGAIVILAEHELDLVETLADDVLVLEGGRLTNVLSAGQLDRASLVKRFGG